MGNQQRACEASRLIAVIRQTLNQRQRIVCARYWFDDRTHDEIGVEFRMDRTCVGHMIERAEASLRAAGITPPLPPHSRRIRRPLVQLSAVGANAA